MSKLKNVRTWGYYHCKNSNNDTTRNTIRTILIGRLPNDVRLIRSQPKIADVMTASNATSLFWNKNELLQCNNNMNKDFLLRNK